MAAVLRILKGETTGRLREGKFGVDDSTGSTYSQVPFWPTAEEINDLVKERDQCRNEITSIEKQLRDIGFGDYLKTAFLSIPLSNSLARQLALPYPEISKHFLPATAMSGCPLNTIAGERRGFAISARQIGGGTSLARMLAQPGANRGAGNYLSR